MVALRRDNLEMLNAAQAYEDTQISLHNQGLTCLLMHTQSSSKIYNEYFTGGIVKNDPLFNNLSVNTTKDEKPCFKIQFQVPELCSIWNEHF